MRRQHVGIAGLCVLLTVLAGCGRSRPGAAPRPSTAAAAQACREQLRNWADRSLDRKLDHGLDDQEMALSDRQYDVLLAALDRARPVRAAQGVDQAKRVAAADLQRACEEHTRAVPQPRGIARTWPQ